VRWSKSQSEILTRIGDIELAILKTHLVLEEVLKFVLATRLRVSDDGFRNLRIEFFTLVEVAMAGLRKPHLVGALRALNKARNHISHRLESPELSDHMRVFMREVGRHKGTPMTWPVDADGQLPALLEASEETAWDLLQVAVSQK
jgi:hypothetical protein